jgi:hypothetical protein
MPESSHHFAEKGFIMKKQNGRRPSATPQRMLRAKVRAPSFWTRDLIWELQRAFRRADARVNQAQVMSVSYQPTADSWRLNPNFAIWLRRGYARQADRRG